MMPSKTCTYVPKTSKFITIQIMGEQDMLTYNIIGVNCEKVQEVIEEALEKEFGESTTKV